MLSHATARDWLIPYADGMLAADERRRIDGHITGCAACAAELREVRELNLLLVTLPPAPPVAVATFWLKLQAVLPQLRNVPTLLVWGSKDRAVDAASAEPLRSNFQSAQFAVIEGAGHLPYEECPEEFSRIVTDFLQSAPASAGANRG